VDGIVEAMDLRPDLVICAGNALVDALAWSPRVTWTSSSSSSARSCPSPP
jgi:hypothetical protein